MVLVGISINNCKNLFSIIRWSYNYKVKIIYVNNYSLMFDIWISRIIVISYSYGGVDQLCYIKVEANDFEDPQKYITFKNVQNQIGWHNL